MEYLDDPNSYFLESVPRSLGRKDELVERLRDTTAVAQIVLSGPTGGTWHFVIERGDVEVAAGPHATPSFSVTMSVRTWRALRLREVDPKVAFMSGKIKIRGSMTTAMKIAAMLR